MKDQNFDTLYKEFTQRNEKLQKKAQEVESRVNVMQTKMDELNKQKNKGFNDYLKTINEKITFLLETHNLFNELKNERESVILENHKIFKKIQNEIKTLREVNVEKHTEVFNNVKRMANVLKQNISSINVDEYDHYTKTHDMINTLLFQLEEFINKTKSL